MGCEWSEWSDWTSCSKTCGAGGVRTREREKLPGLGKCEGEALETDNCEDVQICPLENDANSLVVVIGGETSVSRENEHSKSVEIMSSEGVCRLSGMISFTKALLSLLS